MRLALSFLSLLVPATASASSPAICADQEINLVQTTVGVGCPIYAVNPTLERAEIQVQINQGTTAEVTPVISGIPVTVTQTRCDPEVCQDVTTSVQRSGELLRLDLPDLRAGDVLTLYPKLGERQISAPRIQVTNEACLPAPPTLTVTACTGSCDFVSSCDEVLGCAASTSRGAGGSWAFPLLALGCVAIAGRAGRRRRR